MGVGAALAPGQIAVAVLTVAVLNTANSVFLKHKSEDVTLQDVELTALINAVTGGLGSAAGQAFGGVGGGIYGALVNSGAIGTGVGSLVSTGPKDSVVVWRHQDKCPTGKWYDKHADGSYTIRNEYIPLGGCNLMDLIVPFYSFEFSAAKK